MFEPSHMTSTPDNTMDPLTMEADPESAAHVPQLRAFSNYFGRYDRRVGMRLHGRLLLRLEKPQSFHHVKVKRSPHP
jgi:hypothetical protein